MLSNDTFKPIFDSAIMPLKTSMKDWIFNLFISPFPSSYVKQLLDQLPFVSTLDSLCKESPEYLPMCISWAMEDMLLFNTHELPIGVVVVATIFTEYDDESVDVFYENLLLYSQNRRTIDEEDISERIWKYIHYLHQIRI